ncbi:MAG: methionine--tRNA ligase [bacterium]|nr:methionine--tRNA ligase [bacterium]MDZ4232101.1 methionine--tRNA ligase [Candidatus Pacearchaeota archaeon]
MEKFYVTSAIPYVNARPHLGHALEFVQADVISRFHRQKGEDVLLLSGSDDNALKNVQAAEQAGVPVEQFVEENGQLFFELAQALGVHLDIFQRGTSKEHHSSSQKLWELCRKAGDIYKDSYEGLYCVGCEVFYVRGELNEKGECPEHPGKKLEKVSEENYFFRLSKYQKQLVELLEKDELRIIPESRKNEMLAFLREPLQDISISRSNERARNWGVPVPEDEGQRMYVWFDALNIYQSGIGFGSDEGKYKKWWPADVQVIGKGIARFHAVYWPAFLLSAGLPLPKVLFVHGYLTVEGKKMSKSVGNVVDPFELIERYGADALRYFLLREIPASEDGDYSREKFETRYNADLASGLGNLTARVLTLAEKNKMKVPKRVGDRLGSALRGAKEKLEQDLSEFQFGSALGAIWELITICDRYIEAKKPWEESEEQEEVIADLMFVLREIGDMLKPFLPETSERIVAQLKTGKGESLFPRIAS